MAYNDLVQHYFFNPQHIGALNTENEDVYRVRVGAISLGYLVQLHICVNGTGKIVDAKFKAYGNPYLIAGCAYLTEHIINKTLTEIKNLDHKQWIELLALPKIKLYVALLLEDLIKDLTQQIKPVLTNQQFSECVAS